MILSTDSTANLPLTLYKKLNIHMIPLQLYLDNETYYDLSKNLKIEEFYNKMKNGSVPQTAQINAQAATEYFENLLKTGEDILHISFSSALSGNTQTIIRVANELNKTHQNKVIVIDSLNASAGEGILVLIANDMKSQGKPISEISNHVKNMIPNVKSYFTVDNLKYLVKGGRISKLSGIVGSLLNIKPILKVSPEGKLVAHKKVISRKKSIAELADICTKNANPDEYLYITHAVAKNEAEQLAQKIENKLGKKPKITDLTQVIGSHTGPGLLSVFFVQK